MFIRNPRELGGLVRQSRHDAGLTQSELAAKLNTRRQRLIYLERGEGRISTAFLFDTLRVLGFEIVIRRRGETVEKLAKSRSATRKPVPYSIDDIAVGRRKRTRGKYS